jgi:hypothetical protein
MQAFGITLNDNVIEDLINCVQNGKEIELFLGNNPVSATLVVFLFWSLITPCQWALGWMASREQYKSTLNSDNSSQPRCKLHWKHSQSARCSSKHYSAPC